MSANSQENLAKATDNFPILYSLQNIFLVIYAPFNIPGHKDALPSLGETCYTN